LNDEASGNGLDATMREFVSGQKLFSRYTLKHTLGRGGMGVVWLARDEELERDVALKFLPELIIHDRAVLGDLKRETRRSLELTHKNIVRIYDFIHDQSSGCISMEYIDGDTLSNLRADRPRKVFEPDELTDWTSQLCDALDYAHTHARIVHRDLKPANLMVNQRGDLKIADFGIARSLSDSVSKLTMQQGKSGTLVYMSPQQLDGERGNHLDDVYSLGASIYELLTSKPPFYSGNVDRQIREKIPPTMTQRRKELEIEGDPIDAGWEDVVRACLAKNPDRRPQSVSEIAKRLEVPSPKTRRAQRAAGKQSNKRLPLFVAILIAAAAVSGWYFGLFENFTKQRTVAISQPSPSEPKVSPTIPAQIEAPAPPKAVSAPSASIPELSAAPAGPARFAGSWTGTIKIGNEGDYDVTLAVNSEATSLTQQTNRSPQHVHPTTVSGRTLSWRGGNLNNVAWTLTPETDGQIALATARMDAGVENRAVFRRRQSSNPTTQPMPTASIEQPTVSTGPKVIADAVYEGTIHVKNDSSTNVPLVITIGSDLKSGTMTQSGHRGDVVVKFTGVWDRATLYAVTDEVVSEPKGINWEPESFALRFADDAKSATYECVADGKTYVADLSAQSAPVVKAAPIYKGTIRARGESGSGTPLIINLAADRKSGRMTQTSKSGDTVVRFNGIWDGEILRAVTNEVISKPKNIQWKPESFTLRFAEDGKRGSYECNSGGRLYTAELSPP